MEQTTSINTNFGIKTQQRYLASGCNSTYNYANNALFYAFVNVNYRTYYLRNVRENLEWYDGFVNNFHNVENGIFSTQLANSLCNGITKQIFGKQLMYKNTTKSDSNKALDFITNEWSKNICNFNSVCKLATEYSGASGTSVLKINQAYKDFWVEALRQDQFYFTTDSRENITDICCFIKSYINANRTTDNSDEQVNYMVVEHRFYKQVPKATAVKMLDGKVKYYSKAVLKPFVEYRVFRYVGQVNQNLNYAKSECGLTWNDLPKSFQRMLKKDYTAMRINEPMMLPFEDLGVQLVRVNDIDGQAPFARFGKSWLSNIRSYLIEYELCEAYSIRDMWNGQGVVGIPKALTQGDLQGNESVFSNNTLNYESYTADPSTAPKPIINQFALRVDEWTHKKDDILKKIATAIGMSPKIIASYLADGVIQKTATQIDSDDDSVIAFVEEKRGNLEPTFNKILKQICFLYGYDEPIAVRFGANVPKDFHQLLEDTDFLYQNGYINLRKALARLYPDYSESQLDELEQDALKRKEEIEVQSVGEINELGAFVE